MSGCIFNLHGRCTGCAQWLLALASALLQVLFGIKQRLSGIQQQLPCGCSLHDAVLPDYQTCSFHLSCRLQVLFGVSQRLHCGCATECASAP